jgi:arylsulfatase
LTDSYADFDPYPIAAARIYIDEASGENKPFAYAGERKEVLSDDKAVIFTSQLKAGSMTLHTWFEDGKGDPICGAYYVYVERK